MNKYSLQDIEDLKNMGFQKESERLSMMLHGGYCRVDVFPDTGSVVYSEKPVLAFDARFSTEIGCSVDRVQEIVDGLGAA